MNYIFVIPCDINTLDQVWVGIFFVFFHDQGLVSINGWLVRMRGYSIKYFNLCNLTKGGDCEIKRNTENIQMLMRIG